MTTLTARCPRRRSYTDWKGEWEQVLLNHKPFRSASAMRGVTSPYMAGGWLPYQLVDQFRADDPTYAVYSYETPIAWYGNRGWIVPDVRYSVTTDRHQGIVRRIVN